MEENILQPVEHSEPVPEIHLHEAPKEVSVEEKQESVSDAVDPVNEKLEQLSHEIARLHEKLSEMAGKLETHVVAPAPEKEKEEAVESVPDAVNLTIDDKESKASHKGAEVKEPKSRRRGFRR